MTIMKIVKKAILILQKFKDVQKEKKNYGDEIDGIPEYEPHSPTESEQQEEEQNYKIKKRQLPPKRIHKLKQIKKGITKSMKMLFLYLLSVVIEYYKQDAKSYIK